MRSFVVHVIVRQVRSFGDREKIQVYPDCEIQIHRDDVIKRHPCGVTRSLYSFYLTLSKIVAQLHKTSFLCLISSAVPVGTVEIRTATVWYLRHTESIACST